MPPVRRWSATALLALPDLPELPTTHVMAAVLSRYPFLAEAHRLAEAFRHIADPRRVLVHMLTGIESEVVFDTMRALRADGVLALPMHDGIIVPVSAEARACEWLPEKAARQWRGSGCGSKWIGRPDQRSPARACPPPRQVHRPSSAPVIYDTRPVRGRRRPHGRCRRWRAVAGDLKAQDRRASCPTLPPRRSGARSPCPEEPHPAARTRHATPPGTAAACFAECANARR